jgi:D-beta-D-heptose 7-phosphate kinase/D-beta-D-heptose 1-phosphate adenosyltransferase
MSKIMVIGDRIIDCNKYLYTSDRINPENPLVPILQSNRVRYSDGGCCNVSRYLDCDAVCYRHSSECVLKERVYINNKLTYRFDYYEDCERLSFLYYMKSDKLFDHCGYLIISDYNKGFLLERDTKFIMAEALKRNIKVLVDTKKTDYSLYDGAYLIKLNKEEAKNFKDSDFKYFQNVIVTEAEKGFILYQNDSGNTYRENGYYVENPSVSGCGDVFIAELTKSLSEGKTLIEASHNANLAAARKCGYV